MRAALQPVTGLKAFLGISFWQLQVALVAAGAAVTGIYWLLLGPPNLRGALEPFIFAVIGGNCTILSMIAAAPIYAGKISPRDLLLYLAVLLPVSVAGSWVASVATRLAFERSAGNLLRFEWGAVRFSVFFSLVVGATLFQPQKNRRRLERRNQELENQVTLGEIELKTQEAELKAAHEIQAHLLPSEIPRVPGFQVSCAWQPARSVGGDYFDVLALTPGQFAVCLADVSGKGIAAALLMANLQAAVRAFAPAITGPGALCTKLNEVLCASVAPGKFVTLFYGVIDRETLTLRFENAGHSAPLVLRGDEAIELTEGSTVLGLFPRGEYEERRFSLQSGDCLLLTTDGVTEAANGGDEEFGAGRVTESARAVRSMGAQGIRTRILEDVTRFCAGNFHDDASLIVVTVD
jgi:sigma-B regulation protein RsbU (phosphoserine phosphatase)